MYIKQLSTIVRYQVKVLVHYSLSDLLIRPIFIHGVIEREKVLDISIDKKFLIILLYSKSRNNCLQN